MLSRSIMRRRIGKWSLALMEFSLEYQSQKSIKGQAIANFLTDHPPDSCLDDFMSWPLVPNISLVPWTLVFDGASNAEGNGAKM